MSDNKVSGPEDAVVSEMIKLLPLEKIYIITRCFQERFMGQMEVQVRGTIVKLVFLRKPCRGTEEGDPKLQGHRAHISAVKVVRVMCYVASGKREMNLTVGRNCTWEGSME